MSLTTTPIRSSFQSRVNSEESYCAPWDLKIQEQKLKLLNEQHQIPSSNKTNRSIPLSFNNKSFHRTQSARKSTTKKSFTHRELSPPVLPPFPPGGLKPSCQCPTTASSELCSCMNRNQTTLFHFQHSLPKTPTAYEQPWDTLQTSLINNLHRRSLQKLPSTTQHCSPLSFSMTSQCRHSHDAIITPIDRYFWYHHTMSRRQAENVLETRSAGSFLVRQSESGNQNDYSLSIKTIKGCMHMRICYSEGFYILGECSRPFSSVSCMIQYFSETPVPIRGATHIKLGTPVLRWEISSSSLSNEEVL